MKKQSSSIIIAIIITIIVCIVVGIAFLGPSAIFFWCMLTDDGGKLDNVEKISAVVTENQETLQDIISQVLSPEYDLDFVLDIEEKESQSLGSSKDVDEESFDLEEVCRLSEELEIKKIRVYKDSDVDIVIFTTYSSGIAGSSDEKDFSIWKEDCRRSSLNTIILRYIVFMITAKLWIIGITIISAINF